MQTNHAVIIQLLETFFQGGIFFLVLGIAWKGATFIQWVRSAIERIRSDFLRFEKENAAAHKRTQVAANSLRARVDDIEKSE
jgi:hypothetical protein